MGKEYKEIYKNLVNKYQINSRFMGNEKMWDMLRPHFRISVLGKEFDYWASHNDYKNNLKKLDDEQKLFAFRCVISDATSYLEASEYSKNNKEQLYFLQEFGYCTEDEYLIYTLTKNPEEYLSKEQVDTIKSGIKAFLGCEETYNRLSTSNLPRVETRDSWLKLEDLYLILEELSDVEIE